MATFNHDEKLSTTPDDEYDFERRLVTDRESFRLDEMTLFHPGHRKISVRSCFVIHNDRNNLNRSEALSTDEICKTKAGCDEIFETGNVGTTLQEVGCDDEEGVSDSETVVAFNESEQVQISRTPVEPSSMNGREIVDVNIDQDDGIISSFIPHLIPFDRDVYLKRLPLKIKMMNLLKEKQVVTQNFVGNSNDMVNSSELVENNVSICRALGATDNLLRINVPENCLRVERKKRKLDSMNGAVNVRRNPYESKRIHLSLQADDLNRRLFEQLNLGKNTSEVSTESTCNQIRCCNMFASLINSD